MGPSAAPHQHWRDSAAGRGASESRSGCAHKYDRLVRVPRNSGMVPDMKFSVGLNDTNESCWSDDRLPRASGMVPVRPVPISHRALSADSWPRAAGSGKVTLVWLK